MLCKVQVCVYERKKTKENKTRDMYDLGFARSKMKGYLPSDCYMLGRMLRA